MAITIRPLQGETYDEAVLALAAAPLGENHVVSGADEDTHSGLTFNLDQGAAWISGYYITWAAADLSLAMTASSTEDLYLNFSRDGSNYLDTVSLAKTSSGAGAPNADSVLLYETVTDGSSITGTTDNRVTRRDATDVVLADGSVVFTSHPSTTDTSIPTGSEYATATYVASRLGGVVVKGSDEIVNNSTTLQNDDDFSVSVAANETVFIELILEITNAGTAGFKYDFSLPSGTRVSTEVGDRSGSAIAHYTDGDHPVTSDLTGGSSPDTLLIKAVLSIGGTGGTVNFQWAQDSATVTDTTVKADSFMVYWAT